MQKGFSRTESVVVAQFYYFMDSTFPDDRRGPKMPLFVVVQTYYG